MFKLRTLHSANSASICLAMAFSLVLASFSALLHSIIRTIPHYYNAPHYFRVWYRGYLYNTLKEYASVELALLPFILQLVFTIVHEILMNFHRPWYSVYVNSCRPNFMSWKNTHYHRWSHHLWNPIFVARFNSKPFHCTCFFGRRHSL